MSKYVKLIAKPDTWFKAGTEAYDYDCDENDKYRITLEQWEKDWLPSGIVCARGTRVCENPRSENAPHVGFEWFDGESCGIDEFTIEIVDERV
jgi:hypothetical protein